MSRLPATNVAQRYRPLLELGSGRLSRTYLAASLVSGVKKLVVLKLLHPELRNDAHAFSTFRHAAEFTANLDHPNTAYVFEVVEHEGAPVIVMEYLEGIPLTRLESQAGNRLTLPLRLLILSQVLAGLHHCHELKDFLGNPLRAIHGEVAPHNVVVLYEGGVKIVGFGAAQRPLLVGDATAPAASNVNLHYMPPEQLLGEVELDRRADVYAVGVMLWEAIARRPMWKGMDRSGVVHAFACGALPNLRDVAPETPSKLQEVVMRALSPNLETRYESAQALQIALEDAARETVGIAMPRELADFMSERFDTERQARRQAIAHALQHPATPVSTSSDPESTKRLPWLRNAGIALAPVLLTAGVAWATHATIRALREPKRADLVVTALPPPREDDRQALPSPTDGALSTPGPAEPSEPVNPPPTTLEEESDPPRPLLDLGEDMDTAIFDESQDAARPELDVDSSTSGRRASRRGRAHQQSDDIKKSEHCTPPYRLTEDGLKSFKPECF